MQKTRMGRLGALLCSLSIVGCTLATAMPVYAQAEPRYRIDFSGPKDLPNCNDPDGFRGLLELAQPRDLFDPPASRVLDVRIQAPNSRDVIVDITLEELDGLVRSTRQQTYPRSMECYKILHLAAVAAAVDLDRDAPAEPPAAPPQKPPDPPPPCPPCEVPRAPAPRPPRSWFVGAGARVDFGVAPDQLIGGHFIVGWRRSPRWSFEAHGRATLPEDTRPLGPTVVRVHSLASFAFVPCYRVEPFGFCGGLILGNMWFSPLNLKYPQIDTALFWGAGIRAFLEQRLSDRWSARMDVELFMPILRARIEDNRSHDRWETSIVSGSASASLLVWF